MLQEIQHRDGFIRDSDISRIADQVGEPVRVIQDVISFFPHFRRTPSPKCQVLLCRDMSCRLRGSAVISERIQKIQAEQAAGAIEFVEASCLGRCDRAPAMLINDQLVLAHPVNAYVEAVKASLDGHTYPFDSDRERAHETLAAAEIDCYRATDDAIPPLPRYAAVENYLRQPRPEAVIQAIKVAGLLGMGGAGAPASDKWDEARRAASDVKYVVCNADESEPGTFKDRELLLAAPHLVIEGMIMAALVVGAKQGFIYVRHEYSEQIAQLETAIAEAVALGVCGQNILKSGIDFQLEVFVSPGGYVCGEQTALIEALEGKRSEPRNRPPELQTNGLYDQPTVLNNVETFAWVPSILLRKPTLPIPADELRGRQTPDTAIGGLWYKHAGVNRARGRRFFSVSGDVARPGAYEVPCGIRLGELIDNVAGGLREGQRLQAVALSGPSGGFLPAILPKGTLRTPKNVDSDGKELDTWKYPELVGDQIDVRLLPLDVLASRELGFMLGAGIIIYGHEANMLDQAIACSRFYQRESCGKCVPCRLGARKIVDMAESLAALKESAIEDMEINVRQLGRIMETTSICGLGQVASNPFRSYLRFFHPQLRAHTVK
jgi:formate dehydrogenase/bidirectional [NiFe] hydrogenase diaphorase subunit